MIINTPFGQRFLNIGRKLGVGLQTGSVVGVIGGLFGEAFRPGSGILWGLAFGSVVTAAAILFHKKEQAKGQSNSTMGLPPHG